MPDAPDPPASGGQPVSQQEQGSAATAAVFAAPPPPPDDAEPPQPAPPASEQKPLTRPERQLRSALWIGAFCFLSEIGVYLLPALVSIRDWKAHWIQLPFVANSVVKSGTLGLLCLVAARDVRRHHRLVQFVIAGLLLWVFAGIALIIGTDLKGEWIPFFVIGGTIAEGVFALAYYILYRRAQRARYGLRLFTLLEFRSLTALAEVLIKGNRDQPLAVTPERVAQNVDRYLSGLRSRRRLAFRAILFVFYPLALLGPQRRLSFLRRHFYDDLRFRVLPEKLRNYAHIAIRMAKQLCYAGYYNDPVTWKSIDYDPFPRRAGGKEPGTGLPADYPNLNVEHATPQEPLEGDVVIIGSGAGGSILAHQLVTNSNRDVLMLERGSYVSPRDFSADEAQMLASLYGEGALQLSTDFRYQVLQGNCVGGSTVVNNAVCFPLPPSVLATWNQPPFNVGISQSEIDTCTQTVETLIGKVSQANVQHLNPGGAFFETGATALGRDAHVVDANIEQCMGCGYCNIGCAYGKKLSMLDRVLPLAQQAGGNRMRIVPRCEAERLVVEDGHVRAVVCKNEHGKRVTVRGNTFVLSAGAVASSLLLLRSGIKTDRAGLGLSFNMGSPITAVFGDPIHSYRGLQISHYARAKPPNHWILETWFNPPVAQALAMPGWFERHFDNMNRYAHMTCVGVLVGTESNGSVKLGGLLGSQIEYDPTPDDFKSMMKGIVDAGEIMFAGGAVQVLPATMDYLHYENKVELQSFLNQPLTNEGLTLGTGHPQGGNVMSSEAGVGVVDTDFKVHGKENLFVCDGSVFPTSVGVNPQLSVMALATYAAPKIAAV